MLHRKKPAASFLYNRGKSLVTRALCRTGVKTDSPFAFFRAGQTVRRHPKLWKAAAPIREGGSVGRGFVSALNAPLFYFFMVSFRWGARLFRPGTFGAAPNVRFSSCCDSCSKVPAFFIWVHVLPIPRRCGGCPCLAVSFLQSICQGQIFFIFIFVFRWLRNKLIGRPLERVCRHENAGKKCPNFRAWRPCG